MNSEQIPRFAEPIECRSLAAAQLIREEFPDALHEADDKRKRTVLISADAPRSIMDSIARQITESYTHDTVGQEALTAHERSRIDFTQTNVMHARSCKALAAHAGIDDWTAYYDPQLSVDEHRDLYNDRGGRTITMKDIPYATDSGEM